MQESAGENEPPVAKAVTIVANRLPVARSGPDGAWEISPGGLVTALMPIMRPGRDTWIGWTGNADEDIGTFEIDGISMRAVPLSEDDVENYYRGFANKTLWPLFHDAIRPPEFRDEAWLAYREVNKRFAEAACEVTPEGGVVWVQDYHLLLVPGMIRERRHGVHIGVFLHTPVPPGRLFEALPRHEELLASLASADLIGTQTESDAAYMLENFDLPTHGDQPLPLHKPKIAPYPISIDSEKMLRSARKAEAAGMVEEIRERLGTGRTIFLGVDRLDYTKGIDLRLQALQTALDEGMLDPEEFCLVQIAVPSREGVEDYDDISNRVDALVGAINGHYGGIGSPVVYYKKESMSFGELVPMYRAADIMLVTPLRDGMNLVAKEYLATRYDGTGELILSEFAGSAQQLAEATLINPHDTHALAETCRDACRRHRSGQRCPATARMHESVMRHDVHEWAHSFLHDLMASTPPATSPTATDASVPIIPRRTRVSES